MVANKVIVGPNQEMICKYVAKEIGNVHSSSGSDWCYLRESELESGHPPWKPSELCVVRAAWEGSQGMGHLEHRDRSPEGFLFGAAL